MEPIITDATLPAGLSGPEDKKMLCSTASAPLPDTGRMSMSGSVSDGMFSASIRGDATRASASTPPDALSIDTHSVSAVSEGMMARAVSRPSFAPSVKASNTLTLLTTPNITMPAVKRMTISFPIAARSPFFRGLP